MSDTNKALIERATAPHITANSFLISELVEALRKADALLPYVQHLPGCEWEAGKYGAGCTCGLAELQEQNHD